MKLFNLLTTSIFLLLLGMVSCKSDSQVDPPDDDPLFDTLLVVNDLKGKVVLNEVRGRSIANQYIEMMNVHNQAVDIGGVRVEYESDETIETIGIVPSGTSLAAGAYYVFDKTDGSMNGTLDISKSLILRLIAPYYEVIEPKEKGLVNSDLNDTLLSVFNRDAKVGVNMPHPTAGSYVRFPEDSDEWIYTAEFTKGAQNVEVPCAKLQNGIWMWTSHYNDIAYPPNFQNFANNGIGHVLLNEGTNGSGITNLGEAAFQNVLNLATAAGLKVHIWFQCFYNSGGWVNPILRDPPRLNQAHVDGLVERAKKYASNELISGIHLDYIRFPGTAGSNNFLEINAVQAITETCRQLNVAVKAINPHIKMSAAVMNERAANATYYGQDTRQMSQWIDILMPMVYRYYWSSGARDHGNGWVQDVSKWFCDEFKASGYPDREVWVGIQTYTVQGANDSPVSRLTADQLKYDCMAALRSNAGLNGTKNGATGIVLFRYDLVNYFDMRLLNSFFD